MDVEALLQSVIRFSNFMTSRLLVAGVVFYVASGFTDVGSASEGFLPSADLLNEIVQNYQNIFDVLGVSDFALLLILFVFLTTIHLIYVVFNRIGDFLPPAIIPLSGWEANDDVTRTAFDILREARGEEHTDEENQRLYEFKKKLREIEQRIEQQHAEETDGMATAYRIAKTFVATSLAVLAVALFTSAYSGDVGILAVIFALSLMTVLYTAFGLLRANALRIAAIRHDVIVQFLEFSRIWAPQDYQQRIAAACTPSVDLKPARFAVQVPIFGTLDEMIAEMSRWRARSGEPASAPLTGPRAAMPKPDTAESDRASP